METDEERRSHYTQTKASHDKEKGNKWGEYSKQKIHVVWRFENCLSLALSKAKKQKAQEPQVMHGTIGTLARKHSINAQ